MAGRRIRLDFGYDGTGFAGWQLQPGKDTIQGRIESALSRIYHPPGGRRAPAGERPRIPVVAAGRTDAGVHAEHQTAHFDAPHSRIPPDALRSALNHRLPGAVRVHAAAPAAPDFHAQHHATEKTYRYHLLTGESPSPLRARFAWPAGPGLDRREMERAAAFFPGEHDFTAFRQSAPDEREKSPVRTIRRAAFLDAAEDEWIFEVAADGFLRYLARRIVGSLVAVGRRRITADSVGALLRNPRTPGPRFRAPAAGLRLHRVDYPEARTVGAEKAVESESAP